MDTNNSSSSVVAGGDSRSLLKSSNTVLSNNNMATSVSVSQSPLSTSSPKITQQQNGTSSPSPNGANTTTTTTTAAPATTPTIVSTLTTTVPAAKGGILTKIDYKFEEYEEAFLSKQIINDPLKISVMPDLLSVQVETRSTSIIGPNVPEDVRPIHDKLSQGIQESINVFQQDWTVIHRDPLPSTCTNELKPLSVLSYECDGDVENASPTDAVKELNQELVLASNTPTPDQKIIEIMKTQRVPIFHTYLADDLPSIEQPKLGKPIIEQNGTQITVECTEFKPHLGSFEPFFGRMFLFDANAEETKSGIITEEFHFDLGTQLDLLPPAPEEPEKNKIKKCIFTVNKPSTHIYLIVCFDKIILGDPEETTKPYFNLPGKPKEVSKFQNEVKEGLTRLGKGGYYRQPFVWGCIELFDSSNQFIYTNGESDIKLVNLTRVKGDLYNFVTKTEKKQTTWCDCNLKVGPVPASIPGRLDPLLRLKHPSTPESIPLVREIYTFENPEQDKIEPHITYTNVLYLYPKSVNLTNFKSDKGSSARNIFLEVKLLEDDTNVNNQGLKSIHGNSMTPILTKKFYTSVVYHNRKPKFSDEIKINLPPNLTSNHHLLITFYHLGCRQSKKNEKPEVALGYSAVRLFENDQIIVDGKYKKPVATVFPPKYLAQEAKDIKEQNLKMWVDNKKPVFSFRVKVVSSLYPQNPELSQILKDSIECDHNILNENIKKISEVPARLKLQFFPALTRILFKSITNLSTEIAKNAFLALLNLVDSISKEQKSDEFLASYITYIFNSSSSSVTLYDFLIQTWNHLLESGNSEKIYLSIQYSWFLFGIIRKSMVIDIDVKNLLKNGRNRSNRFPDEFLNRLKYLFELLLTQLKQMYNTKFLVSKSFIVYIAHFINDLLDIMNRGFIFRLINSYVNGLDTSNTVMELTELKFMFLRVLASSDSFIPLNIPCSYPFPAITDVYQHFYKKHFLVGTILQEVASSITAKEKDMRLKAIMTLREIMSRYDTNPLYNSLAMREKIASLYFPLILIVVENFDAISKFDANENRIWMICFVYVVKNLINSTMISDWWKKETQRQKIMFFKVLHNCLGLFEYGKELNLLDNKATGNSLASSESSSTDSPNKQSRKDGGKGYKGKSKGNGNIPRDVAKAMLEQNISNLATSSANGKAERTHSINHGSINSSTSSASNPTLINTSNGSPLPSSPSGLRSYRQSIPISSDAHINAELHTTMAGNLSYEVSMTVLNSLVVFIRENKTELLKNQQSLYIESIFKIILTLLRQEQSHPFLKTCFHVISSMMTEFKQVLFRNNNAICAELALEILGYCNSNHAPNRQFATTLVFLMIQNNLKEMGNFSRMKLQSTIGISKILETQSSLDFENLMACLESITKFVKTQCNNSLLKSATPQASPGKSYLQTATPHKPVTPIAQQIVELRDRLFSVINNHVKIQQHNYDPEMKAELYYQLSNSFIESPDLRITWLRSLAKFHTSNKNYEEAAQVYIIAGALVSGYLKLLHRIQKDFVDFSDVTLNIANDLILPDPSLLEAVEGEICGELDFSEKGFIDLIVCAIGVLKNGFFESAAQTYQLILPIYQRRRDWQKQKSTFEDLLNLCNLVIQENAIKQRIFSNYYRVAFYCEKLIPELHNKEFIYKELNVTRLADLSERLQAQYGGKFGAENIKLLPNNKPVEVSELNPQFMYIQIISVEPYLLPEELKERTTPFEQNTNLNKFIFEVPFTKKSTGKAHSDSITDQWKRKVILTTQSYFPYLKKRVQIIKKEEIELTPIEASIEIIQKKINALKAELHSATPNIKTLQIHLQGCLLLQVNAGPLAICSSFLSENEFSKHNAEHITKLSETMKDFTMTLRRSVLENREKTINDENATELHEQLNQAYKQFCAQVSQYVVLSSDIEDADPLTVSMFDPRNLTVYDKDEFRNQSFNVFLDPHSHSFYSDGSISPEENIRWHIKNGYNVMFLSDHNTISGGLAGEKIGNEKYKGQILVLPAIEWTNCRCHLGLIGVTKDVPLIKFPTNDQIKEIIDMVHEDGGLVILNHYPWSNWAGLDQPSLDEWKELGIDFIEVVNDKTMDLRGIFFARENNIRYVTGSDLHSDAQASVWTVFNVNSNEYDPNAPINSKYLTKELVMSTLKSKQTKTSFLFDAVGTNIRFEKDQKVKSSYSFLTPLIYLGEFFHSYYELRKGMYSFVDGSCTEQTVVVHYSQIVALVFWILILFIFFELLLILLRSIFSRCKKCSDKKQQPPTYQPDVISTSSSDEDYDNSFELYNNSNSLDKYKSNQNYYVGDPFYPNNNQQQDSKNEVYKI
eukprot:gene8049-9900_t